MSRVRFDVIALGDTVMTAVEDHLKRNRAKGLPTPSHREAVFALLLVAATMADEGNEPERAFVEAARMAFVRAKTTRPS